MNRREDSCNRYPAEAMHKLAVRGKRTELVRAEPTRGRERTEATKERESFYCYRMQAEMPMRFGCPYDFRGSPLGFSLQLRPQTVLGTRFRMDPSMVSGQ